MAGYVIARLGRIPDVGDAVEVDGSVLEVREMAGPRVTRVALRPRVEPEPDNLA